MNEELNKEMEEHMDNALRLAKQRLSAVVDIQKEMFDKLLEKGFTREEAIRLISAGLTTK